MSASSTMTSPRWTAMRKSMRCGSSRPPFRRAMACCTSTAQRTASTTLANSTMAPSPMSLMTRPPCSARSGSNRLRRASCSRSSVPASSTPMSLEKPTTSATRIAESLRCIQHLSALPSGHKANAHRLPDAGGQGHVEPCLIPGHRATAPWERGAWSASPTVSLPPAQIDHAHILAFQVADCGAIGAR